jgi:Uncharacterised nucleotidyltransferase
MQRVQWAATVYDVVADGVLGFSPHPVGLARASRSPLGVWARVLGAEGCGARLSFAARRDGWFGTLPLGVRTLLDKERAAALWAFGAAQRQVTEMVDLGVRVMLLKGTARALAHVDEPSERGFADVDVLVSAADAQRLHKQLRDRLGYVPRYGACRRHFAPLQRAACLPVELHIRLGNGQREEVALTNGMWEQATGEPVAIPSATHLLLHTLAHATDVDWAMPYRLRDVTDVATAIAAGADLEVVERFAAVSSAPAVVTTLVAAALSTSTPGRELARVRRVGRARAMGAVAADRPELANRLLCYAGLAAAASPRVLRRALSSFCDRHCGQIATRHGGTERPIYRTGANMRSMRLLAGQAPCLNSGGESS